MTRLLLKFPCRKLFILKKREKRPTHSCLKEINSCLQHGFSEKLLSTHSPTNAEKMSVNKLRPSLYLGWFFWIFKQILKSHPVSIWNVGQSLWKSMITPTQNFKKSFSPWTTPVSMMVGQVFTSTAAAASLDFSSLIKVWVVRIQAALLT